MLKRIGTAIVLLGIVFGTLFGLRQISLFFADALGLAVIALGAYEMFGAFKRAEFKPLAVPAIVAVLGVFPLTYFLKETGIVALIFLVAVLTIVIFTFDHSYDLRDMLATLFIALYPVVMFAPFFLINHSAYGLLGILLLLLVPVMTDTLAYFTGVLFKGPKLCPTISPKKTVSGAIGGLLGGVAGALIVFALCDVYHVFDGLKNSGIQQLSGTVGVSASFYVLIGVIGGIVCELGDLGASWIKRRAEIKDFGNIFPGHGGMMDRLDSILFMMPVVYLTIVGVNLFIPVPVA